MADKDYCDTPLTLAEVIDSITLLKNNKSPDGLSAEFYKAFSWKSIENDTLPPSLTQGLVTLIPKPRKDVLFIDSWRPICLLNNDYKILSSIFSRTIKETLDAIRDETQSGFKGNRHISNNIRLVLDILDYS